MTILVTGAAGFIGSNFVLDWLAQSDEQVINLDNLTYAGNLENLASLDGDARHLFVKGDIGDFELVTKLLAEHHPRTVVNFAAESHVDRSIHGPEDFIQTNIVGTFRLLEAVRAYYGQLRPEGSPLGGEKRPKTNSVSCMSPPTKFTARSPLTIRPSPKPTSTNRTAPTRPARRPATIWCAPTTTPMACQS
jgi:nucleoside-diphosphate-sugar epimerase